MRKGSTLNYLLADHLGSTVTVVNPDGSAVRNSLYWSFGGSRLSPSSPATDKLYTGQQQDATGLYFYQARWYDGAVGRFLSPDTIVPDAKNPQALNRYSYVYNSPLRYTDPNGHCAYADDFGSSPCFGAYAGSNTKALMVGGGSGGYSSGGGGSARASSNKRPASSTAKQGESAEAGGREGSAQAKSARVRSADESGGQEGAGSGESGMAGGSAGGTSGTRTGRSTRETLQDLADEANNGTTGSGHVAGTKKHKSLADKIKELNHPKLKSEVSFRDGEEVHYGTEGSIRVDVVEYDGDQIIGVYDFKTGSGQLNTSRIDEIRSHLPNNGLLPNSRKPIPVIEIR
ncbi:MAG: RHS repeat-associated core domain-containing protein [Chloroflexi bacterium]|nr:RHS repeat-associated core domain-containing protein [Chloroflexota bacterium]